MQFVQSLDVSPTQVSHAYKNYQKITFIAFRARIGTDIIKVMRWTYRKKIYFEYIKVKNIHLK